jgi:multidrug resistance protein
MTDPSASSTLRFSRSEIVSILSGLMLAMFLAGLDQTIVATSLSTMARDLDGWELMSWVVSVYLVASTVTTPIYGRLSDIYGRRPVLLIGIALFLGSSVLCALSQTMPQLIASRALQGIGGGGLRSVSQAAIADVIPPRERGRYQGYFSSVMAFSNLLGPVLGGFFADYLTWHWIFWINIPFGILALILCNRNLRRLPKPKLKPAIDWFGAALILGSTTPILIAVDRVEVAGGRARVAARLAPNEAGIRLIPMTGGTVLGSFIAGRLVSRTGRYRIFPILGAAAMTLICATIALTGLGRSWALDTILTAALGLSFGFQLPTVIVPVQNALDLEDTGIGLSAVMFFRLIGGAFGVALLTALLVGELNSGALAIPGHDVLGPNPGIALLHLDRQEPVSSTLLAGLQDTVRAAFSHVFLYAAVISALTTVASFGLKEIPLRSR